ncbi:hypothetical protein AB0B56_33240 [Streptosporangium canum]|uniref:Lipoprotein LprG n=1 Tax=Streptosporangium canum TaxID=324952 RepID=A0A1I3FM79_9ACTN|nr:hypothetical protein [Streptosporangium canum]SFI12365.1 hypothetical protein SAMN05216275_101252 [Streptosporangium canum]
MKRWIILASGALILPATAVPADARTAPADPVATLKTQFVAQRGVRIVESGKTASGGSPLSAQKRGGVVQFGVSGVAGYDILTKSALAGETARPLRTLAVGGSVHTSGGVIGEGLPDGRRWMRAPGGIRDLSPFLTPVLVLEPATLKTLLSTSTAKKPGATLHGGKVTFGALYRASPSYRARLHKRPSAKVAAMTVTWRLWLGRDGLPSRLVTSWAEPPLAMKVTRVSDVRFASWGTPVNLTAPVEEAAG